MLRLIGDVHALYDRYLSIIKGCSHSVQLGDFGFDYSCLANVDPTKHKLVFGNHESYDWLYELPHSLGDFGECTLNGVSFFFVRGSISIDKELRIKRERRTGVKTWWANEELSYSEGLTCLDLYGTIKPQMVVSHDCPAEIKDQIGVSAGLLESFGFAANFTCSTQHLLQQMLEIHRPEVWIFAHFHKNRRFSWRGTRFICLEELGFIDI